MELNREEMQDLVILLQVAYSDATEMQNKSHGHEEIEAYEDHKRELNTWIVRIKGYELCSNCGHAWNAHGPWIAHPGDRTCIEVP